MNVYRNDFATLKISSILRSESNMKYVNAENIFPVELLNEIQKYVNGEMVYIPISKGLRKNGGKILGVKLI